MFAAVRANGPAEDDVLRQLISVDSTSVRTHQHAAGAPTAGRTGDSVEQQGIGCRARRSCVVTLTRRVNPTLRARCIATTVLHDGPCKTLTDVEAERTHDAARNQEPQPIGERRTRDCSRGWT